MMVYVATISANPDFEILFEDSIQAQAFCLREFQQPMKEGRELDLDELEEEELTRLLNLAKGHPGLKHTIQKQLDQRLVLHDYFKDASVRNSVYRGGPGTKTLSKKFPNLVRVRTYVENGKTKQTVELAL